MREGRFQDLLSRLVERDLDADEMAELDAWLRQSSEARREYLEYVANDVLLQAELAPVASSGGDRQRVISMRDVLRMRRAREVRIAVAAAAAVLLVSALVLSLLRVDQSVEYALEVELAPDSSYTIEHLQDGKLVAASDAAMRVGSRMVLEQGVVQLGFESGVTAVVQAPAELTLRSESALELTRGKGWFRVEDGAEGFEVVTPEFTVKDLGTEFGVVSVDDGADQVHVFEGIVEVTHGAGAGSAVVLNGGAARELVDGGDLREVALAPHQFLKELPEYVPYVHWAFEPRDGYVDLVAGGTHPLAEVMETGFRAQSAPASFVSTPGVFGQALHDMGQGGLIGTDWPGIGGDAPRTIAYWVKLEEGHRYLYPVLGWGERRLDPTRVDKADGPDTSAFFSFVESLDADSGNTVAGLSFGGYWVKGRRHIGDGKWHHVVQVFSGKYLPNGAPHVVQYVDGWQDRTDSFYHEYWMERDAERIEVATEVSSPQSVPVSMASSLFSADGPGSLSPLMLDEVYVIEGAINSFRVRQLMEENRVGEGE
ncbi:FecR domain-containing protein [Sulfuriroseicoccus oceanibius]|uniref:FecR domain-containing protein n=1 Tax=Sulfuriroseicoccus oceanibius TaxID=2707525 RepID=A0A6B3L997_9BACT|nr:FecR domain-containing protein [Sulfuriroseicoccus oceanibius]QQL45584.1 FecR domain-containing protein [Sulfuriroseicoccus oceanibius]